MLHSSLQGQSNDTLIFPTPTIGWDSLHALLAYPEIARRAGFQGGYLATIRIDTIGNVQQMKISQLSPQLKDADTTDMFRYTLYNVLRNVRWHPASQNGQKLVWTTMIPIVFILNSYDHSNPIIINVPAFKQQPAIY